MLKVTFIFVGLLMLVLESSGGLFDFITGGEGKRIV